MGQILGPQISHNILHNGHSDVNTALFTNQCVYMFHWMNSQSYLYINIVNSENPGNVYQFDLKDIRILVAWNAGQGQMLMARTKNIGLDY